MRRRLIAACLIVPALALAGWAAPAHAQRPAISAALSPADAAKAFEAAVMQGCVPMVVQGVRLPAVPGASGAYAVTSDVEARRQAGAAADEQVWNAVDAKGVVTISEKAGRCTAHVYGPSAAATVMAMGQALVGSGQGFERLGAAGGGISQTLMGEVNGRRVQVIIKGSEPGMPGHQSRFSVVTATVFALQ